MEVNSQSRSNEVLIEDSSKENRKSNKAKKMIISMVSFVALFTVGLALYHKGNSSIPKISLLQDEDLDFTEEGHRQFCREVATQTMVLATNFDVLPLRQTDQVVLFGDGTENTMYGGWGSGEVYNKGTSNGLTPVKVKEGIENKADRFIYVVNNKGYQLGGSLNEGDIQHFAEKTGNAERTVAILTVSRRSGEGSDRPQDGSSTGTKLSDNERNTYNALTKYFDKVVLVLICC